MYQVMVEYLDQRMPDGSRLFASFKFPVSWPVFRQHLEQMQSLKVTRFVTDGVTEGWLDFDYFGHHFTVNDPQGEFFVFVDDAECPSFILGELMKHFRKLKPSS